VIFTSFLVSFLWGWMLIAGNVRTIWPMFGTANQLLSAIALALAIAIATTYIIKRTKKIYSLVTLVPFIFMITTTTTAGIMNIKDNYLPMKNATGYINVFLTIIILILAFIITISSLKIWIKESTKTN